MPVPEYYFFSFQTLPAVPEIQNLFLWTNPAYHTQKFNLDRLVKPCVCWCLSIQMIQILVVIQIFVIHWRISKKGNAKSFVGMVKSGNLQNAKTNFSAIAEFSIPRHRDFKPINVCFRMLQLFRFNGLMNFIR